MKKELLTLLGLFALAPKFVSAHCPLCTAGAGVLAVFAASIGVKTPVVGVFIGAFALALGLWMARLIKKKHMKYQDTLVAVGVYLLTIVPIMPFIIEYRPLYISFFGEYGTLFHNTYLINPYVFGSVLGGILLFLAPYLSRFIARLRNGQILPYQGLGITFILLIVAGVILQLTI